jgi:hypothetical protein
MEMVKSLMEMVPKLSCELQTLESDNIALKLQLRDLHQFHTPPPSISREALSSAHDAAAKTYRDVLTSGGGHPASTAVPSGLNRETLLPESSVMANENREADGFITVLRKRKKNYPSSIPSGVPNHPRRTRTSLLVIKAAHLVELYPREPEPRVFLSPNSLLMHHQLTFSSL